MPDGGDGVFEPAAVLAAAPRPGLPPGAGRGGRHHRVALPAGRSARPPARDGRTAAHRRRPTRAHAGSDRVARRGPPPTLPALPSRRRHGLRSRSPRSPRPRDSGGMIEVRLPGRVVSAGGGWCRRYSCVPELSWWLRSSAWRACPFPVPRNRRSNPSHSPSMWRLSSTSAARPVIDRARWARCPCSPTRTPDPGRVPSGRRWLRARCRRGTPIRPSARGPTTAA